MTARVHWQVDPPEGVDDAFVERCVKAALHHGARPHWSIAVVFVDDPTLARLHDELFDDPSPTDVIAVDISGDDLLTGDEQPDGEVFVSVDRACAVAARRALSPAREIGLYVVHGVLHLCGWRDVEETERARMRAAEREVLRALGFADDVAAHDEL